MRAKPISSDSSVVANPKRLAQFLASDFSDRSLGQRLGAKHDLARPLVVAEWHGTQFDDVALAHRDVGLHADDGARRLAPARVRYAEHRDLDRRGTDGCRSGPRSPCRRRDPAWRGSRCGRGDRCRRSSPGPQDAPGAGRGIVPGSRHPALGPGHDFTRLARRNGLLVLVQIAIRASGRCMPQARKGCEPDTSANHWRGPIIATGSISVWP